MSQQSPPDWITTVERVSLNIGLISNEWAKLEHLLVPLTAKLMGVSDLTVAKIVVFSFSAVQRKDLISALAAVASVTDEWRADLRIFLSEMDSVRIERNNAVHGYWFAFSEDGTEMIVKIAKSRPVYSEKSIPRSPEWLLGLASRISSLSTKARTLSQSFPGATVPTPPKQE